MIKVGSIVHYFTRAGATPLPALVVEIVSDATSRPLNLRVFMVQRDFPAWGVREQPTAKLDCFWREIE